MNNGRTAFEVYRNGNYVATGSLLNISKFIGCSDWTLKDRLKKSNRTEYKEFVVIRVAKEYSPTIKTPRIIKTRSQKQMEEYYNAVAYGLNATGIAIGSYKYPVDTQKEELYKLGITQELNFILCKEGKHKWYRVEVIK